jgi:hypothetical protein
MTQALMANALSSFLHLKKRTGEGLYTKIIVMDNKGLNVGLSDPTPNYWHGDEDIWRQTFLAGPGSIHIGRMPQDKSPQRRINRISFPVIDPVTRGAIGAVSIGIDVARLPR